MDLVDIPQNPVPSDAVSGDILTRDRIRLRIARWRPTAEPCRGTVCVFPGRAEFIEKYFETVGELRQRGFAVAVLDWRGQGGSQRLLRNPLKNHISDFARYDRDLAAFMEEVVLPDCPPPYFALGHSMGAHVLLRNATRRPNRFDRMVLVSPLISLADRFMPNVFLRRLLDVARVAGLSSITLPRNPAARPLNQMNFEGNPFTSDPERFARIKAIVAAAPHLVVTEPTFGWVRAALASIERLADPEFAARMAVPALIVAAGDDRIVSSAATEQFALRLKLGRQIVLPGALHELLTERDVFRDQFWAAFDAFVPGEPAFV